MQQVNYLRNPVGWRRSLGLLPIPLMKTEGEPSQYVLLNGQGGNFCLDLSIGNFDPKLRCSSAWSANVGHYLHFSEDYVELLRWDQPDRSEKFSTSSVVNSLEKFHTYLVKTDPKPENSIVQHCLRVFRTLRQILGDEQNGFQSLSAFLVLLACATDGKDPRHLNGETWGLSRGMLDLATGINSTDWETLNFQLSALASYKSLRPDYKLMLRHASGALFQEAHYQAQISLQSWLPGFGPTNLKSPAGSTSFGGIFFTPQSIARTLAEEALRHIDLRQESIKVFDPACGSAELLKECLRILELKDYQGKIEIIGWDISPGSINMAKVALAWEARSWTQGKLSLHLEENDSLEKDWPRGVDILLMNPPFKSWQNMSPQEQEKSATLLHDLLHNKPNLASVFTKLAADCLKTNGVLGMVAPSSFFDAESTKKLRDWLTDLVQPKLVAKLGSQNIFYNAIVDSGLFVAKKEIQTSGAGPIMMWADHSKNAVSAALRALRRQHDIDILPVDEDTFSLYKTAQTGLGGIQWSPGPYKSWLRYQKAEASANAIHAGKIFDIKQGARLGNDVFLIPKDVIITFSHDEQRFFRPAVINSSLQYSCLNDEMFVFFPYGPHLSKIDNEHVLEQCVPVYYQKYLYPLKSTLQQRKTLERGMNWWDLSWPRSWQFEATPKIVSKYFGNEGSFAWDETGMYAVVVGNAWVPRKPDFFVKNPDIPLALIAYLNSRFTETLISYISVHVGGGQCDLSKKYLSSLPIPIFEKVSPNLLQSLHKIGSNFTLGEEIDLDSLDELCEIALSYRSKK